MHFTELTIEERDSAPVTFEAVSHLVDMYIDGFEPGFLPPHSLARDLHRKLGEQGRDIFDELMTHYESPAPGDMDAWADWDRHRDEIWQHCISKPPGNGEVLLVDALQAARDAVWVCKRPAPCSRTDAVLDELARMAGARRAERTAADAIEDAATNAYFGDVVIPAWHRQRLALFPAAQRLAAQHPQWREDFASNAPAHILALLDPLLTTTETPCCEGAQALVSWVEMYLDRDDNMHKMEQFVKDVNLAVLAFEHRVRRHLFPFDNWLLNGKTGFPDPTNPDNVRVFLRMKQANVRFNEWHRRMEIQEGADAAWLPLTDVIMHRLMTEAGDTHNAFRPAEALFRRTVATMAHESPFDPLVDQIKQLEREWDGVPRLNTWLARAMHVTDDAYHSAVGRVVIGNMVRRARQPGCKADEVLLLSSSTQGFGKSSACEILALQSDYFTDSVTLDGSQQNVVPQLFGKWVIELGELAKMGRSGVDHVKQFISSKNDHFTAKYSALASDNPRRCIFIGTTNSSKPLTDDTGNRRWLPVNLTEHIDTAWLRQNIKQIIGEAAALHSRDASFAIPEELWGVASQRQESARAVSSEEELIIKWFDRTAIGATGMWVASTDIGHALRLAGHSAHARYGEHMKRLGYRDENIMVPELGKRTRLWVRSDGVGIDGCVRLVPVQNAGGGQVDMRMNVAPQLTTSPIPPCPVR